MEIFITRIGSAIAAVVTDGELFSVFIVLCSTLNSKTR